METKKYQNYVSYSKISPSFALHVNGKKGTKKKISDHLGRCKHKSVQEDIGKNQELMWHSFQIGFTVPKYQSIIIKKIEGVKNILPYIPNDKNPFCSVMVIWYTVFPYYKDHAVDERLLLIVSISFYFKILSQSLHFSLLCCKLNEQTYIFFSFQQLITIFTQLKPHKF